MLKQQRADHLLRRLDELYPETSIPLDHKGKWGQGKWVQCANVDKEPLTLFPSAQLPHNSSLCTAKLAIGGDLSRELLACGAMCRARCNAEYHKKPGTLTLKLREKMRQVCSTLNPSGPVGIRKILHKRARRKGRGCARFLSVAGSSQQGFQSLHLANSVCCVLLFKNLFQSNLKDEYDIFHHPLPIRVVRGSHLPF
jgi:hypothetical protein